MRIKIPEKSIFGYKVLNTKQSVISAYFLLLFSYTLNSQFGTARTELIGTYFFNIISNSSFIILLANSILKRKGVNISIKIIIVPLIFHLPLSIIFIFDSSLKLFNLLF